MTSPVRRVARDLGRAVSWHRRKLAVLAAVGAVLTAIAAASPADPPTTEVVQIAAPVSAGQTLTGDHVRMEAVPVELVPDRAVTAMDDAVGRTVAAARPAGALLTAADLVGSNRAAPGQVVAPLTLADTATVALLRPGDRIDVLAAAPEAATARVVATRIRVVTVPRPDAENASAPRIGDGTSALVLVEVPLTTATTLAQAAATAQLSIVLR